MTGQRKRWSNWPQNQNGKRSLSQIALAADLGAHAKMLSSRYSSRFRDDHDMCLMQISPAASILHVDASFKNPYDMPEEQHRSPPSWRERTAYRHVMHESFCMPICLQQHIIYYSLVYVNRKLEKPFNFIYYHSDNSNNYKACSLYILSSI